MQTQVFACYKSVEEESGVFAVGSPLKCGCEFYSRLVFVKQLILFFTYNF